MEEGGGESMMASSGPRGKLIELNKRRAKKGEGGQSSMLGW